ncbi:MAG: hypothetical protein KGS48_12540 [Bacteroidetes bacterium]|nr:hypothetical protein [Bacteroidota bacterium]
MKPKTILAILALPFFFQNLAAQAPQFCERMDMRCTETNAVLELSCADCAAITEVQLYGDGVTFTGIYHGDAWKEKFPKNLNLQAGDYTLRVKMQSDKWKTMHLYVPKKRKEVMVLN